MAAPSTVTALADISQSLWTVQLAQSNAFNGGAMGMNQGRDLVLYVQNYALANGIENDRAGVRGVSSNVYRLCGSKLGEAQELLSSGSGGIVPSPSGGNTSTLYYPINVTLTSGDISGMTIVNTDWKNLVQLSPNMILNDVPFTLNVNYSYGILNGVFDFTLSSYTPQVGDTVSTFGFKPIT